MDDNKLKTLIKKFSIENDKASQILGKVKIAKKRYDTVSTDFLTLNEKEFLKEVCFCENLYLSFQFGDDFERDIALVSPIEFTEEFPTKAIRITGNFKFEKVNHRDYLGSILGLGIKREKIGDINVFEDFAEVLVHNDICDYIIFNLSKVKHTGVKVKEIDINCLTLKEKQFEEKNINISSLRLDSVVSGICNISRSKASSLIKGGEVKINNIISTDVSTLLKEGFILTIKGYGKAKIGEVLNTTKKDRLIISVYKYI